MTGSTDLAEASRRASEYSARPAVYFLNDATDPVLPAGPGTIGLEIIDQLPDVASIYVPMGDTALIRGVGAAVKQLKPSVRIIGVQAERAPSYVLSWRANKPVPTDSCDTCADGLATSHDEPLTNISSNNRREARIKAMLADRVHESGRCPGIG